jgi:hypothetical protein
MKTVLVLLAAGSLAFSVSAQTTPDNRNTNSTQQQTPQRSAGDPLMMDDNTARELGLREDQMAGWKERSTMYDKDYRSLKQGKTYDQDRQDWMTRRDKDMGDFLTPDQLQNWNRMNGADRSKNTTGSRSTQSPATPKPSQPNR